MKTTRLTTYAALTIVATAVAATTDPAAYAASDAATPASISRTTNTSETLYKRILQRLPADWKARRDSARKRLHIEQSPVETVLLSKLAKAGSRGGASKHDIDPTQYQCGPTKLDAYVDSILANVDDFNLMILSLVGALDMPTYEAILYGTPTSPNFQVASAYRTRLRSDFGKSQRFWDVRLGDVQLMGMHGEMLSSVSRVARTVQFVYEVDATKANQIAKDIVALVKLDPALKGGKHPIFTLNAFAFSGKDDPDPVVRKLRDKMVFGDGIFAALKAVGLNSVGPRAVLGHEMAHHVQYEDNLFVSPLKGAEATRRTELMADAFGTYFVTHKKGLAMNPSQILQVEESFYDVGDCAFEYDGHHGTPNQRRAASAWGAATVAYATNPWRVLPSKKLAKQFDKVLPQLVKPDAPTSIKAYKNVIAK